MRRYDEADKNRLSAVCGDGKTYSNWLNRLMREVLIRII